MSSSAPPQSLAAEWQRVELLGRLLAEAREGREVTEEQLVQLRELQRRVEAGRNGDSAWNVLDIPRLEPLEYDVLALAVAPEAEPRLGWMFQNLQCGAPQRYPTIALIHELLALDASSAGALWAVLAEDARLRCSGLLQLEGEDPFQPVRPGTGVCARLLGRPLHTPELPGAIRVRLRPTWDELVLPKDRVVMLKEFLLWLRHRKLVFGDWGGRDCGGPVALFTGPSGTGKTFAAAVLAADLDWPLFRVDLGCLVSKYIGETEKNINRLFDGAHGRTIMLQFDEADSLFSKRGEVKEARDRYANMEVSHLLARIESHQGPCILTTNLRRNLDAAFARRFQVVVDFPRPDSEARARLWDRLLPMRAPREPDLDTAFIGEAVTLTGGQIRNAALHAAFLAAEAGRDIGLPEVTLAVWRELSKEGRELTLSDLGPLARHFPQGAMLC